MSFNRLMYDTCATVQYNNESVGVLDYMLDPVRMENPQKCRHQLGLLGGTNVSHIQGNLVDLETDLFGITRKHSNCPCRKYLNKCAVSDDLNNCQRQSINIEGNPSTVGRTIDTTPMHLQNCQTIRYKPVPLPQKMDLPHCPAHKARKCGCGGSGCSCGMKH
jgi:hypothetical protein